MTQSLVAQAADARPVAGQSAPHESAHLHVSGAAPYVDDLPELTGTLHAALGLSPIAHGHLRAIDLATLRAQPGVVEVITAADLPAARYWGPILQDDPLLAPITTGDADLPGLSYRGQPVFAVIALTRDAARRAAALAPRVLRTDALPATLDAREAHARGQYVVPPMHLSRGDAATALALAPHRMQGSFSLGGQEQFYLEGQISYAAPQEDACVKVWCSTQHPTEMQHTVAHALGLSANQVRVECRRMGGGFGGKESQSAPFAVIAAVAAQRLGCPVKLRLDRDDDFLITGRRHPFEFDWDVGFDDQEGRVLGVEITMISNAGHSADLSPPVMTRALCHFDNAYWLPHVAMHGYCARTHTQSNTAFRGFGGPQGAMAIEVILDDIAHQRGLDPVLVRQRNYYGLDEQNTTPYEQRVDDNIIAALAEDLLSRSDYTARRASTCAFNAASPVLKRGLGFTPVKFGISFNVAHFNQAGALVHVYTDGSVLVNHGGTEMGQGLNTKVAQVVAHELGVPLASVRITATDTHKVANTSATAASTGSDLNGKAAEDAAHRIRERLAAFLSERDGVPVHGIHFSQGMVTSGTCSMPFADLVQQAYAARVQLWSEGFYATPGLHWDRQRLKGKPFFYFSYGAALSEVELDTLTGEWKLLRADVLHDVGRSLNPAIDIGQIEGAFVQGMGWLTTEELWWQPMDGSRNAGLLMTHAPSTYKIPTAHDAFFDLRVNLYGEGTAYPNPADTVHHSKAVGEPPLLLPISVFLALRDAVAAVGDHKGPPVLPAPATAEALLTAINVAQAFS